MKMRPVKKTKKSKKSHRSKIMSMKNPNPKRMRVLVKKRVKEMMGNNGFMKINLGKIKLRN